jgi:spermidine synthase
MSSAPEPQRRPILLAVAALGVSCVMTQLALMRELMGAFSGNEMVLGVVLGLWLLLMGIGAWLGRSSDKLRRPLTALVATQMLVAVLPLLQVFLLRALRNVVFIRGAEVGVTQTLAATFVLLLPYCLAAGYALTLACSLLARITSMAAGGIPPLAPAIGGSPNQAAGSVYVADSIGSVAGGVLFSFVLIRFLDHITLLVFPALLNLLAAGVLGFLCARKSLPAIALLLAVGISAMTFLVDMDSLSTGLLFQKQHIVARANSPYGKLIVTESDGQYDFIENGVPLTSTHDVQHVEETVHYAMAQRPDARKVLLVSGGVSGTAKEILKYNVGAVDYVELDPLVLKFGRKYLPENLADSRIRIINTDGRLFIKQAGDKYDVVIVDAPDPSTAQLNRFFTVEFLAEVKRVLAKDGVLSFSLGHYENYVSPELARMLASAGLSLKPSFQNVLVIPGGRVYFLASDGPLFTNIAARVEQRQIKARLVNRHYLDAMLAPDRMADIGRAMAQPAAVNRDFSPVLYYYHLRHWMSQFNAGFGPLQAGLLVLLCVYLPRLRGSAFVLFASGFAGSAIELVLLLAFQVLCGSVYHQVGVIVTVFMAGLALGAFAVNRSHVAQVSKPAVSPISKSAGSGQDVRPSNLQTSAASETRDTAHSEVPPTKPGLRSLAALAFAIAGYAILLPLLLPLLNRMGGSGASLFALKAVIALLTLTLAVLVGAQFPIANRLESGSATAAASRLYTADFIGACLGALLACTLLIPLIGVTGVCLLTAALNLLGGARIQFRKVTT